MKLLIADDEEITRQGLKRLNWSALGISEVREAANGKTAMQVIRQDRPDLILTDIQMPGMTGLELARLIREEKIICKVIILTGYEVFDYAKKAVAYQVFEYLLKPSDSEEILSTVRRAMETLREDYRLLKKTGAAGKPEEGEEERESSPFEKILRYLGENYMNDITLTSLAEAVHFSAAYCSRYIKRESSYTFTQLLFTIRMLKAAELIASTHEKIFLICEKVGINDQRYFSKQFKKMFHKTPLEFRKDASSVKKIDISAYLRNQLKEGEAE